MKINKKYEQIVTMTLMVLVMTFVVTFVNTARNNGFQADFILLWLKSWGFAYIVALPTVMIIMPLIKKLVSSMVIK